MTGTDLVKIARGLPAELQGGDLGFVDPDTGEALPASESSDRALLHTLRKIKELEERTREMKLVAGAVLRQRHGVGVTHSAGFGFRVNERQSWPRGPVVAVLNDLLDKGVITEADYERALPSKPTPDGTQIKALIGRIVPDDPAAAKRLGEACTRAAPSVLDIEPEATDAEVVE